MGMGSDTDEDQPQQLGYNQRALVKCDASYLGSEIPTLTTQPPGIIHQPLAVICSKKEPPSQSDTPSRNVRLNVFHSSIIIEILHGKDIGKCVNYPIQNLYCSAALLPHKTESGEFEFLTLEDKHDEGRRLRPIFAVVMREVVSKRVLRCHAFAVVNRQIAGLLVKATAVAFREKKGWNQPVIDKKFSSVDFLPSILSERDHVTSIVVSDDEHVSRISVGADDSTDGENRNHEATAAESNPIFNDSVQHNHSYIPSDMHHTTLVPSPSLSSASWSTRSSRLLNYSQPAKVREVERDTVTTTTDSAPSEPTMSHISSLYSHPQRPPVRAVSSMPIIHAPSDAYNSLSAAHRCSGRDDNANWDSPDTLLQRMSLKYPAEKLDDRLRLQRNYSYDYGYDRLMPSYHPEQFMYSDTMRTAPPPATSTAPPAATFTEQRPRSRFKPKVRMNYELGGQTVFRM